jgi:hypothetical protein
MPQVVGLDLLERLLGFCKADLGLGCVYVVVVVVGLVSFLFIQFFLCC